jgi:hypothetical protein
VSDLAPCYLSYSYDSFLTPWVENKLKLESSHFLFSDAFLVSSYLLKSRFDCDLLVSGFDLDRPEDDVGGSC